MLALRLWVVGAQCYMLHIDPLSSIQYWDRRSESEAMYKSVAPFVPARGCPAPPGIPIGTSWRVRRSRSVKVEMSGPGSAQTRVYARDEGEGCGDDRARVVLLTI